MKMKMKIRLHRLDKNRPKSIHGRKYCKYKVSQNDDTFMY